MSSTTDPSGRETIGTSGSFVVGEDTAWASPEPGVERQVLGYDRDLMLVRVAFEEGAVGAAHSHPHRQATYVARGAFEVTIDGQTRTLRAGDSFFVAPGLVHGVVALEEGELIDAFCPGRSTFVDVGSDGVS